MTAATSASYDYLIKLLLIGDSGVGKSCLLMRFCEDSFTPSFITTIGIDFKVRTVDIDGRKIKLQIWDTAGQERFRTITTAYYRGAMGILLVYDVTSRESLDNLKMWLNSIEQHAAPNVNKAIVGNKCDLDEKRMVTQEQGQEVANELGLSFREASAKTGEGVAEVFLDLALQAKKRLIDTGAEGVTESPLAGLAASNVSPRIHVSGNNQSQVGNEDWAAKCCA